jgi:molybdopterin molybdotransferase
MTVRRSLSYAEARERVLGAVRPGPVERVNLAAARGRALREPLTAPHPLPPFDNASMDGWAARSADLAGATAAAPVNLAVVEILSAGRVPSRPLGPGEAMRIMTGAMLPQGADAVIPFEDAEGLEAPARVRVGVPVARGDCVRPAGADLAAGATVLVAGHELSPHDLALLAALGFAEIAVGARPAVAILSTGDELLEPHEPLRPGAIRESNITQLAALLEECGCTVALRQRLPDDVAAVTAAIRDALALADVVLTTGGVSAGDHDPVVSGRDAPVKLSLDAIGEVELWRVAMRPGKPQAFGAPGGRLFFGLPGNPGSVACVFETLVRPALRKLQGFAGLERPWLDVRAAVSFGSQAGRRDFLRVTLSRRDGEWWAAPAGPQISGYLTPQSRAHALLVVAEEAASLEPGDTARALLLRWPEETT